MEMAYSENKHALMRWSDKWKLFYGLLTFRTLFPLAYLTTRLANAENQH